MFVDEGVNGWFHMLDFDTILIVGERLIGIMYEYDHRIFI